MKSAPYSQYSRPTEAGKDKPTLPKPVLWKPTPFTGKEVALLSASPPNINLRSKGSPVRLNMAFGGVGGEKLPLLNRIVALLDNSYGLFQGFRFFYDDGTSMCHGTPFSGYATCPNFCAEMSFVVCGEQGERVTEMRAHGAPIFRGDHIRGLTVWCPGSCGPAPGKPLC